MSDEAFIDNWGVVSLYVGALRSGAWIQAISTGYTLLEMQMHFLLRSKARQSRSPVDEAKIASCSYLLQAASLAKDEGLLPVEIFDRIRAFNTARNRAIHRLASGAVTMSELENTARLVSPLYGEIQELWLRVTVAITSPEDVAG